MHRSRDGAQLIVEATTRHSANSETATDESFSQLNSPRRCSWASRVQRLAQLPNKRCPEFGRYIVRQLNKRCLSFLQRRNALAERQTRLRQCLHPRPAELRVRPQL